MMLRICFLQHWFNLSDPAAEEALYDSPALRGFAGIDLGREPVPDETTVCRFRHLLEAHDLCSGCSTWCSGTWGRGLNFSTGTIVDATVITAPVLDQERGQGARSRDASDQEGNRWYFGMKAPLGVDSRTKLIHSAVATPANVADSTVLPELLHGRKTRVWSDQAYRRQRAAIRQKAPRARDFTNRRYRHRGILDAVGTRQEPHRSRRVRAKVEHPIGSHQAGVRFRQGALPRAQEERPPPHCHLRAGQPVHGAPPSAALPAGGVCPNRGSVHGKPLSSTQKSATPT